MRTLKRRAVMAIAVLAVVALLAWALMPAPVPVDVAIVTRGALQVAVEDEGETRVRDRFVVSAPLPGRLLRVEIEPGDPVQAGQTVVARLLPSDPTLLDARTRAQLEARLRAADASIGGARAERQRVEAELEYARRDLARARELLSAGLASREAFDAVERRVRTAEEALRSAEFAVRTADYERDVARAGLMQVQRRSAAEAIALRSPVDGVVLRRLQESETTVQAGQPILAIGNLHRMEIVSDLLSTDAVKVRPGQRVLVEQWGGDRAFAGRVRRVEPSGFMKISALGVEEQRVNVLADFDDPAAAAEHLGDGYRVELRIVVWEAPSVLQVPTSSLFRHEGEWAVYDVVGGVARRRAVRVGQRSGLLAEVREGLAEGKTVITYPSDDVADGVRVRPR